MAELTTVYTMIWIAVISYKRREESWTGGIHQSKAQLPLFTKLTGSIGHWPLMLVMWTAKYVSNQPTPGHCNQQHASMPTWHRWNAFFSNCLVLFSFWPHHKACRILVPWRETDPVPPAMQAEILNHWTAREVPAIVSCFPVQLARKIKKINKLKIKSITALRKNIPRWQHRKASKWRYKLFCWFVCFCEWAGLNTCQPTLKRAWGGRWVQNKNPENIYREGTASLCKSHLPTISECSRGAEAIPLVLPQPSLS